MASWNQQPAVGDKFWVEGIGSGKITYVYFHYKLISVDFFEKGLKTFEFDDVLGNWSEDFGGTWMLFNI